MAARLDGRPPPQVRRQSWGEFSQPRWAWQRAMNAEEGGVELVALRGVYSGDGHWVGLDETVTAVGFT